MNRYCLIGHPLGHSISPQIHKKLFELSGVKATYNLYSIKPETFESEIENLREFNGFNVTIPYKQKIIRYLDRLSERAEKYGAVNTVKNENGILTGYNTDADGFIRSLGNAGIPLKGDVLLCGAGGAAVMMACEALDRGCRLYVAARSFEKAEIFTQNLLKKYPASEIYPCRLNNVTGRFDLILNATPSGMYPNINEKPLPDGVAAHAGALFDAIYNPGRTLLMQEAESGGAKVQGGLPMLVWQAAAAQGIWTGARFSPESISALCVKMAGLIKCPTL